MQYMVIEAGNADALSERVQWQIGEGWRPCGGVAVCGVFRQWENAREGITESDETYTYAQAMTKPASDG